MPTSKHSETSLLVNLTAQISRSISTDESLKQMLRGCTQAFVDELGVTFARIWTLNPKTNVLELQASSGLYTHLDGEHARIPVGKYKIGLIAQEKAPHITNDVSTDPLVSDSEWAKAEGIVSFAGHPLMIEEQLIGVMGMFSKKPLSDFTIELLQSVANNIAVGINRKQIAQSLSLHEQLSAITETMTEFVENGDFRSASAKLLGVALKETRSQIGYIGGIFHSDKPSQRRLHIFADGGSGADFARTIPANLVNQYSATDQANAEEARSYPTNRYVEFSADSCLASQVISTRAPVTTNSPDLESVSDSQIFKNAPPLLCYLGVPLLKGTEVTGVFAVANRLGGYNQEELQTIQNLAYAVSAIYDNFSRRQREISYKEELKSARDEAMVARDAALKASDLKTQFVANISHEIRTPMSGVLGLTELALMSDDPKETREFVETAHQSAKRLMSVVNELLDFSKLQAGRMDLRISSVYIASIFDEVVQLVTPELRKKKLSLVEDIDAKLRGKELAADPKILREVLLNLVHNAVKFTNFGKIEMKARCLEEAPDRVIVEFSVTDTGMGITDSAQHKVFQPFMQADVSNTRKHGGTGIGLSIAKGYVELMKGKIDFVSKENHGTTFKFSVPLGIGGQQISVSS